MESKLRLESIYRAFSSITDGEITARNFIIHAFSLKNSTTWFHIFRLSSGIFWKPTCQYFKTGRGRFLSKLISSESNHQLQRKNDIFRPAACVISCATRMKQPRNTNLCALFLPKTRAGGVPSFPSADTRPGRADCAQAEEPFPLQHLCAGTAAGLVLLFHASHTHAHIHTTRTHTLKRNTDT